MALPPVACYPALVSIAWVLFWKGVVLALWAAIAESWLSYKRQRNGLTLRYSKRAGSYVVHDWTQWVDTAAVRIRTALFVTLFAFWTYLVFGLALMGKGWTAENLFTLINWLS